MEPMEDILTVPEVAEYLKLSKSKTYRMVQQNKIPYVRIGRNVRIRKKDLLNWIEVNCIKFQLPDGQYVFFNPHT
ncbi:MAG: helix-turn-helix domain-containing protein [Anaerolineales bacterium]|nr:helix-turn-helix domain-containing protein [Anaerolineales bacterium]